MPHDGGTLRLSDVRAWMAEQYAAEKVTT
jgi:hypothetical protein